MNNSPRYEWKVGLFIFLGLLLIALLMLNFSRGITLFQSSYEVRVIMPTISGLKPKAVVMMSGIPIGTVASTDLAPNGTNVVIKAKILSKYKIHADADFHIDALGFLGDQYLAITPLKNAAPMLHDGDTVTGHAPFNMQEAIRSTAGLLEQARKTMQNFDQTITNINQTILSQQTLTNFAGSVSNFQAVTENASRMSASIANLLETNSLPLTLTVTNLLSVSEKLNRMADSLQETLSTNRAAVTEAVKNFRETAANLNQISAELQAGKGLAGSVLKDERLRQQTSMLIYNLNLFSSNLNHKGLWSMLWKPKPPKGSTTPPAGR